LRIARLDDAFSGIVPLVANPVEGPPLQQKIKGEKGEKR